MFDLMPSRKFPRRRRGFEGLDQIFDLMDFDFPQVEDLDMRVDIREDEDKYLLEAELPGVDKEDVKLEIADNLLCIEVEHKDDLEEKKENYIRKERKYGSFRRKFYIDDVDVDKAEAKLENGVLKVELPKLDLDDRDGKRIEIK